MLPHKSDDDIEDGVFTEATEQQEERKVHPQYKTIMRNIKQQTRLLKLSRGFHPTKAKLSHDERKAKRKTQRASRKANR